MEVFHCKQFSVLQSEDVFKITTDATLLGALAAKDLNSSEKLNILEIGCGTGIISLMLAQRFPNSQITAIDNNPDAVYLAQKSIVASKFAGQIKCKLLEFQELSNMDKFDLIVSNPPYFQGDSPSQNSVQKQSRHMIDFNYQVLLDKMCDLLAEKAMISIIHPVRYDSTICEFEFGESAEIDKRYFRHHENAKVRNMVTQIRIDNSKTRIEKDKKIVRKSYFSLKNERNTYSDEYINLLRDFLTIF